jgi:hypothetical protein
VRSINSWWAQRLLLVPHTLPVSGGNGLLVVESGLGTLPVTICFTFSRMLTVFLFSKSSTRWSPFGHESVHVGVRGHYVLGLAAVGGVDEFEQEIDAGVGGGEFIDLVEKDRDG